MATNFLDKDGLMVALRNVVYKPPWSGGAEPRPRRRPSV